MLNGKFIRITAVTVLMLLSFMTMVTPAFAATISPNIFTDEDSHPAAGAGCSLREAIRAAFNNADYGGCTRVGGGANDTINLAAGMYSLTLGTIVWDTNLGGGGGPGDLEIDGASTATTIIDGTDSFRLFDVTLTGGNLVNWIDFTIQDGGGTGVDGGALRLNGGNLDMTRVMLRSNNTTGNGGAIWIFSARIDFVDTELYDNSAANGGAIFTPNVEQNTSKLYFTSASIDYKLVRNVASGDGGAVYLGSGDLQMYGDWHYEFNRAIGGNGGAIYATRDAKLEISGATQVNGDGPGAGQMGIVFGNSAGGTGSALYWDSSDSSSSMTDICFAGNSEYSVFSTIGHKVSAPDNWWSSPYGPLIQQARNDYVAFNNGAITCADGNYPTSYCTAAAFSNGDSISGAGGQAACQNCGAGEVAMGVSTQLPDAWGDGVDNNPPNNGDFLLANPGDDGCVTCQPASAIDPTAIACFP